MKQQFKIYYSTLLFLTLFITFFSINALPINPAYVLALLSFFLSFLFILKNNQINFLTLFNFLFANTMLILFLIWYFLSKDTLAKDSLELNILSPLLFILCIFLGASSSQFVKYFQKNDKIKVYMIIEKISLYFFLIEFLVRFLMSPSYVDFYSLKETSIFFLDSNFTAISLTSLLFYYKFLEHRNIYKISKIRKILFLILLILTFSRAAILGYFLSLLILNKKFFRLNFSIFIIIFTFIMLFLITIFQNGYNFLDFDESFNSKFILINKALDIYENITTWKKFFGIGLGNFEFYADRFAHNIFITFLLEFGIINSTLLIIYFFILYKKSNGYVVYILTPTIIIGFSLFSAYSVSLFIFSNLITSEILAQKNRSFYEKLQH